MDVRCEIVFEWDDLWVQKKYLLYNFGHLLKANKASSVIKEKFVTCINWTFTNWSFDHIWFVLVIFKILNFIIFFPLCKFFFVYIVNFYLISFYFMGHSYLFKLLCYFFVFWEILSYSA